MIIQSDFRQVDLSKIFARGTRVLTVTDPPYNINFKYKTYKDNLEDQKYIDMIKVVPRPAVFICYPEETLRYIIPALGRPEKMLFWCYNSHLPRAVRMISFFDIEPDLKKYKIPYRNPTDKRVKALIAAGSQGTALKEWFVVEQVKNVSKEYQGYVNQIPEKVIEIILKLCEYQFDVVFDPFMGSATTLKVARDKGYPAVGCDIDPEAIRIANRRLG